MPQREVLRVKIKDANVFRRNFEGRPGRYNDPGKMNFLVSLDHDLAVQMARDGFNVKGPGFSKPEQGEDEDRKEPFLQVAVGYDFRPPRIVMFTSTSRVEVTQEMVQMLDWVDIAKVDIIFNGSPWSNDTGASGIKAWLKTMVIWIEEDELEIEHGLNNYESSTSKTDEPVED